jgi:hypothetical protein
MSRPSTEALESDKANWVSRLNSNFEKLLDTPFPMALVADSATLASTYNAKLGAVGSAVLYKSDGAVWAEYKEQLTYIAPLDTGTATIPDIRTAYNGLLADLQAKGWMS